MKNRIVAAALAVLIATPAAAGEKWCALPDTAYSLESLTFDERGFSYSDGRCDWLNVEQTRAHCPGMNGWTDDLNVDMERHSNLMMFDISDRVSAGRQPYRPC